MPGPNLQEAARRRLAQVRADVDRSERVEGGGSRDVRAANAPRQPVGRPEAVVEESFITDKIVPREYLAEVYRSAPGGVDRALNIAQRAGAGHLTAESLNRPVEVWRDSNLTMSNPGLYDHKADRIEISSAANPDRAMRAARHELDHAINRDESADARDEELMSHTASPLLQLGQMGQGAAMGGLLPALPDHSWAWKNTPDRTNLERYYAGRSELRAEFLAPIKHWGAAQGRLPKNEAEAQQLLLDYFKAHPGTTAPVFKGSDLDRNRPAIMRRLLETPGIARELLKTVDAGTPDLRRVAQARLAELEV